MTPQMAELLREAGRAYVLAIGVFVIAFGLFVVVGLLVEAWRERKGGAA
jgi:hypothetical protein